MIAISRTLSRLRAWHLVFSLVPVPSAWAIQEPRYASVQPTQDELPAVAVSLRAASRDIAGIWSGFWSTDESFALLSPQGGMLLVAAFRPPSEFSPLSPVPAPLIDRAYTREGALPGMRPGTFPGTVKLAGETVYALPPMGSTLSRRVKFYVHEAFHYHQLEGTIPWVRTSEDTIMGLSPRAALRDPSVVDDSAFRAGVFRENEILARMVTLDGEELIEALGSYLALRAQRIGGQTDVLGIERRYERREGTAEYIGCRAGALVLGSPESSVSCILEKLTQDERGDPVLQLLRWRLYSVGAVLSLVLDRLGVGDWKEALAGGEYLDVIAARVVQEHRHGRARPGVRR